ncbi:tyrosine-protein phosphatase [Spirillospora sp. NPDC029432]|uniref:tyrosine-protein phosphatase n=1 Tax=Spirillospora sp. NPDC029432 TaxID=3154599 RepID=UPI003455697B
MRLLPTLTAAALTAALVTAPAAHAAPPAPAAARQVQAPADLLQGTANFRDLGGYRTFHGFRVENGLVYRADALNHATDADLETLAGLGVRRVVDFRTPLEVSTDGADRLPAGLESTARPVSDTGMFEELMGAIASKDPARQEAVLGGGRGEEIMRGLYRSFVTDPESRAMFGRTLRDLADRSATPLVFHCTSGKDRTGWLSYVLLEALGVPHRTAQRDFLLSNDYRRAADAAARERLRAAGYMRNPDLLIPMQEVRADYLAASLDQVRRSYGSLDRYLRYGLGVDPRTQARLRHHLLTR